MEHARRADGAAVTSGSQFWLPHPGPRARGRGRGADSMGEAANAPAHPYHHGDLSRALLEAARRILEAEGPAALSLRTLARRVGVSRAAPYHHFKNKTELLKAVAQRGWQGLSDALARACETAPTPREGLIRIGLAYVTFARANPALYRLMCDTERDPGALAELADGDCGFRWMQRAITETGGDNADPRDLELATVAAWCVAHGLAETSGFRLFEALKQAMGEEAFLLGVLGRLCPSPSGSRSRPEAC